MALGRLTDLQARLLSVLAEIEPRWTLGGGAALAAVHTRHRGTRDLDLFWNGRQKLEGLAESVERRLRSADLDVEPLQTEPGFARFRVSDNLETVVVDLVAEPSSPIEPPALLDIGGAVVYVATPHEILVEKLAALLGRLELRDLVDVKVLLESGGNLEQALLDVPRKDAGFSPLTLAWVLKDLAVEAIARASGTDQNEITRLTTFRDRLVERIMALAEPEG